jgi:hypothetical protein
MGQLRWQAQAYRSYFSTTATAANPESVCIFFRETKVSFLRKVVAALRLKPQA